MATGDALGAPYDPGDIALVMNGGGSFDWAPVEWTDDTQMALVFAQTAVEIGDRSSPAALDRIARGSVQWMSTAADVGVQTSAVIAAASTPLRTNTGQVGL